ncbi:MAG: chromosomal replication initiator protein DnaA [Candidatus Daviesbacteria bacterium]|nr:chromosomal replication initiator protein DnaA [Candidatus Daviesbacteria bacterium]
MDTDKLWRKISQDLKSELSSASFRTWFSGVGIASVEKDRVTISAPSGFIQENIRSRYLKLIEELTDKALGTKTIVDFVVIPAKAKVPSKDLPTDKNLFQSEEPTPVKSINPKYTLENFVVGLSNNVAYAAAQAVSQNPGTSYNPLFIYGGTGVGKTHLMLGIGNALLAKYPHYKVIYCSSEKFTNDYVESIQTRKMGDFRSKYRSANILLVDDVQFFSGREGTQEEFFHTFNELTSKNCQLVLTSDRPPGEMPKLEDRLKSRFQGGLMVDMQLPDFDTRVAILRAKCAERKETIPDESLNLIAASLETNGREIEGKLVQLLQILKIQNLEATPENIANLLGQKPTALPSKTNYRQVLTALCTYFNIKASELTGPKRNKELVLPRHFAMYILSEEMKLTVEKVGEVLGGRDHTTVMHGRDRIKRLIDTDKEIQRIFKEVRQSIA